MLDLCLAVVAGWQMLETQRTALTSQFLRRAQVRTAAVEREMAVGPGGPGRLPPVHGPDRRGGSTGLLGIWRFYHAP
ncbi:hypothetical protein DFAR_330038 [Desulfarculales bacterium]